MLLHRTLFRLAVSGLCHSMPFLSQFSAFIFSQRRHLCRRHCPALRPVHASYRWHQQYGQRCVNVIWHHITPRRWHQRWNSTCAFIIASAHKYEYVYKNAQRRKPQVSDVAWDYGKLNHLKSSLNFYWIYVLLSHTELHRRHRSHQKWESDAAQNRNERTTERPKSKKEKNHELHFFFTSLPYSGRTGARILLRRHFDFDKSFGMFCAFLFIFSLAPSLLPSIRFLLSAWLPHPMRRNQILLSFISWRQISSHSNRAPRLFTRQLIFLLPFGVLFLLLFFISLHAPTGSLTRVQLLLLATMFFLLFARLSYEMLSSSPLKPAATYPLYLPFQPSSVLLLNYRQFVFFFWHKVNLHRHYDNKFPGRFQERVRVCLCVCVCSLSAVFVIFFVCVRFAISLYYYHYYDDNHCVGHYYFGSAATDVPLTSRQCERFTHEHAERHSISSTEFLSITFSRGPNINLLFFMCSFRSVCAFLSDNISFLSFFLFRPGTRSIACAWSIC